MIEIEFLFEGNFEISRQDFHFKQGERIFVDEQDAKRLVDGKCAVYYQEKVKYDRKNRQQMDKSIY